MSNIDKIYNLATSLGCDTKLNEPMKKHTSFKIGGNAAVYIKVSNLSRLGTIIKECKLTDTKFFCSAMEVIFLLMTTEWIAW